MFKNFDRQSTGAYNACVVSRNGTTYSSLARYVNDVVELDELSDGSEYNPKSHYNNLPVTNEPHEYNVGRNVKLNRNHYIAVTDIVSEDANYYNQSDLEELIVGDNTYARSSEKSVKQAPRKQRAVAFPPASVPKEAERATYSECSGTKRRLFAVHSVLEEIRIEDDETMFAVLTMDDERLNHMLQEAKRLNLVEKFSVIQAMRDFGGKQKIAKQNAHHAHDRCFPFNEVFHGVDVLFGAHVTQNSFPPSIRCTG
ncbi:hypothetical protein EDB19DRAFT_1827746 [Suillus lakei]|nr:hypothetical protein EDB19DRAFT_1827746 [Suillus lakei]